MKIAVALKQTPAPDSSLRPDAAERWIQPPDLGFQISEADAYALEAALQLQEHHGAEVLAVSAGPPRAAEALREALAKGADRAIHIEHDDPLDFDSLGIARLLAAVLAPERPDLVLTGLQSDDFGCGQTGVILAELMGWPHASIVVEIEIRQSQVRVKRELEQGRFQSVELPLPALLAVQSGISRLRYATLMGIKRAKTKPFVRVRAAELGVETARVVELVRVFAPPRTGRAEIFTGPPAEAAAQLVDRLRSGGHLT